MDLPAEWKPQFTGYAVDAVHEGSSRAEIFRLSSAAGPVFYLKTEPTGPFEELPGEAARLRWLAQAGVPAPRLERVIRTDERNWLLMSEVPGSSLASNATLAGEQAVAIMVDALHRLHSIDIRTCPFDARLRVRLEAARKRLAGGAVDETDFDEERLGRSAVDLLGELLATSPDTEDLVVVHGDFSPENLVIKSERFEGFVDCARLGVADRHQDLGIATRSIARAFGNQWVAPLLRRYGGSADEHKLRYYRLLDEFF